MSCARITEPRRRSRDRASPFVCGLVAFAAILGVGGCDELGEEPAPEAPSEAEIDSAFGAYPRLISAEMQGNVAVLRFRQSAEHLRRGGRLWARVGPYIYLFSPPTRDLFETQPGLAAVRVITMAPDDTEVARALLRRDALSGIQWRRALNIAGRAIQEGTQRPPLLETLIDWGEEHTTFEYSRRFSP